MPAIKAIYGQTYPRPSTAWGSTYPDLTFCAVVGAPYESTGPTITRIERAEGRGPEGFFDKLVAYAGDDPVLEVPAWFAHIEYEHDRRANEDLPF